MTLGESWYVLDRSETETLTVRCRACGAAGPLPRIGEEPEVNHARDCVRLLVPNEGETETAH